MGTMRLPLMPPIEPMLARAVQSLPEGAMGFEPKWDGFRAIIFRDGEEVEIGSRNGKSMTRYFPELIGPLKARLPSRCVVDGEIILVAASGDRLDFEALQQRIHPAASRVRLLAEQTPARFVAFDLLALGDGDFTARPFTERRAALEGALAGSAAPIHLTAMTRDRPTAGEWLRQFEGKDLSFIPLRPERVVEVKCDHMEGERFRHTAQFLRWRPDRDPRSCTYGQLEEPASYDLTAVLGTGRQGEDSGRPGS